MKYSYNTLLTLGLLCFSLLGISCCYAQQTVGVNTREPNPNAVLHLVAPNSDQGLLVPQLTAGQRNSAAFISKLSAQENGLLVYDTSDNNFYYWHDGQWSVILAGNLDQFINTGAGLSVNAQNQLVNTGDVDSTDDITTATLAAGDVEGTFDSLQLRASVVEQENLADNSVSSSAIIDNTVAPEDLQSQGANKVLITTDAGTVFWENLNLFETVSLSQGHVFVGNTANVPSEVDLRGFGNILVGNGNTATAVTISGDLTLTSDGMTQVTSDAIGSAEVVDGALIDQDISSSAGIAVAKLEALPTGSIIFGNQGVATAGLLTGDATLNAQGQLILENNETARTHLGLGSMATQNADNVTITGGSVSANSITGVLDVAQLPTVGPAQTYGDGTNPITSLEIDTQGRVLNATVGTPSDRRLKQYPEPLKHSVNRLQSLSAYYYQYRNNTNNRQIGLMAQDLAKVYPELVTTYEDGYQRVNYTGLVPVLVSATNEQQEQITRLSKQVQKLSEENRQLRQEIKEIKALLSR